MRDLRAWSTGLLGAAIALATLPAFAASPHGPGASPAGAVRVSPGTHNSAGAGRGFGPQRGAAQVGAVRHSVDVGAGAWRVGEGRGYSGARHGRYSYGYGGIGYGCFGPGLYAADRYEQHAHDVDGHSSRWECCEMRPRVALGIESTPVLPPSIHVLGARNDRRGRRFFPQRQADAAQAGEHRGGGADRNQPRIIRVP